MEISTSILNVDKGNCIQMFYNLETSGTDYFHIDVMDGKFVKNNTVKLMTEYSEYLNSITRVPLDVHLMVEDVMSFIKSFIIFEPRNITVHYESAKDKEELMSFINYIKENNSKVGISIKPTTKIEEIFDFLPYVHYVLVMTVEPGEGGQTLIPETIKKIKCLKKYIDNNNLEVDIEADGGINLDNIEDIKLAGCDIAVVGSAIINSKDYKKTIDGLKSV